MSGIRCSQCGLVNFSRQSLCRRCGSELDIELGHQSRKAKTGRKFLKSIVRILLAVGLIIFLWYASLVGSSEPVLFEQRETLERAIAVLKRQGFSNEALLLGRLVYFRSTDNWWNRKVGHSNAFAATNFPFEIITLYPPFFEQPVDDVERAAILLHEAYHLKGYGEETAFEEAWRQRFKLGWTRETYGQTVVWLNVRESTQRYVPNLFSCGPNHQSDCTELVLPSREP